MTEWFITDPAFYAAAIPSVLLLGISKSGFGSGFGSLAVPLIGLTVTVPQAAAILMPVLFVLDVLGLNAYRKGYDLALLKFLVPCALIGVLLGFVLFRVMDAQLVAGLVGVCTLLFLAQRLLFPPSAHAAPPPRWLGVILTVTSGFTSFIAHAGSPPLNAYVLPLRLPPLTFTATMAVLFFFVNMAKWVPYAYLGLLDWRGLGTAMMLLPFAPMGVWIGLRVAKVIQPTLFYRLVHTGLFLTGCKLVWDGFFNGVHV